MPKFFKATIIITFALLILYLPRFVQAQEAEEESCDPKKVKVIFRDGGGNYIADISFQIFVQITNADGQSVPGKTIASGKTSALTGYGTAAFSDEENDIYGLKAWHKNASVGEFYFYNSVNAGCGADITVTEYLSGIKFVLRDTDGQLKKNTAFSVYSQQYDADDKPIKQKGSLVGSFDTGDTGSVSLFVSGSGDSLTGKGAGHYIFESPGKNGGTFTLYDIYVSSKQFTNVNYVFSDMKLVMSDSEGILYPAKTKLSVYKQAVDTAGGGDPW